jgi:hypothetical protein
MGLMPCGQKTGRLCKGVHLQRVRIPPGIHEGTGVGWILHHRTKAGDSRALPLDRAITVSAWNRQVLVMEVPNNAGQRFLLQQGVEDERNSVPHFLIRMLFDDTVVTAHEPRRQGEGQFATFGFAKNACDQATAQRIIGVAVVERDRLAQTLRLVDRGQRPLHVSRAAVVGDGGGEELEHGDMLHCSGLPRYREVTAAGGQNLGPRFQVRLDPLTCGN